MMKFKVTRLTIILILANVLSSFAQENIVESLGNIPEVTVLPCFKDSSMLFENDSIIWTCHFKKDTSGNYYPARNINFCLVDTCVGEVQYYRKSQLFYDRARFHFSHSDTYSKLIRTEPNEFDYIEMDSKGDTVRTGSYVFDCDSIVRIDTIYYENPINYNYSLHVIRHFRTIKK